MSEPKRRLCLPSLNPARSNNRGLLGTDADDATHSSASTGRSDRRARLAAATTAASPADEHTSNSISTTASKSDRVLRYGETVETLFCLDLWVEGDRGSRQLKLCERICGEKCNDAEAWGEVLEGVLRGISGKENVGKLLRVTCLLLHIMKSCYICLATQENE